MKWRRMVGLTVGVGLVLGLACSLTASVPAIRLRRYLSEPLPDGQRYTFLYPDRLHLERPAFPAPGFQIQMTRRINPWQVLTNRAAWTELWSNGGGEAEQLDLYAHPGARWRRKGWWRMKQPVLHGSYFVQAYFVDEKEKRFNFTYSWSPSQDRWCRPLSSQIVDSFRVLAPGEAPPVDTAPRAATASKEHSSAGNALAGR